MRQSSRQRRHIESLLLAILTGCGGHLLLCLGEIFELRLKCRIPGRVRGFLFIVVMRLYLHVLLLLRKLLMAWLLLLGRCIVSAAWRLLSGFMNGHGEYGGTLRTVKFLRPANEVR